MFLVFINVLSSASTAYVLSVSGHSQRKFVPCLPFGIPVFECSKGFISVRISGSFGIYFCGSLAIAIINMFLSPVLDVASFGSVHRC